MAMHIRPTTPPPVRIRVAAAHASAAPLTSGLLAASAGTAGAADSATHHQADFSGEGYGDVAFSVGNATASGQHDAGGFDGLARGAEHAKAGSDLDAGTVAILQGSACGRPGGTTLADSAASSHDRWGAALAPSAINGDGYPMFVANAAN